MIFLPRPVLKSLLNRCIATIHVVSPASFSESVSNTLNSSLEQTKIRIISWYYASESSMERGGDRITGHKIPIFHMHGISFSTAYGHGVRHCVISYKLVYIIINEERLLRQGRLTPIVLMIPLLIVRNPQMVKSSSKCLVS